MRVGIYYYNNMSVANCMQNALEKHSFWN